MANGLTVSADDVWFDLEIDYDIDPMKIFALVYSGVEGGKYLGPIISGKRKIRVKLVNLGYIHDLNEARKKADVIGYRLVEGQALESFRNKFPMPDGKGVVFFGGSEWMLPGGGVRMIYLRDFYDDFWDPDFIWTTDADLGDSGRWLVTEK